MYAVVKRHCRAIKAIKSMPRMLPQATVKYILAVIRKKISDRSMPQLNSKELCDKKQDVQPQDMNALFSLTVSYTASPSEWIYGAVLPVGAQIPHCQIFAPVDIKINGQCKTHALLTVHPIEAATLLANAFQQTSSCFLYVIHI